MEGLIVLLLLGLLAAMALGPILAIVAVVRSRRLDRELTDVRKQVGALEARLEVLRRQLLQRGGVLPEPAAREAEAPAAPVTSRAPEPARVAVVPAPPTPAPAAAPIAAPAPALVAPARQVEAAPAACRAERRHRPSGPARPSRRRHPPGPRSTGRACWGCAARPGPAASRWSSPGCCSPSWPSTAASSRRRCAWWPCSWPAWARWWAAELARARGYATSANAVAGAGHCRALRLLLRRPLALRPLPAGADLRAHGAGHDRGLPALDPVRRLLRGGAGLLGGFATPIVLSTGAGPAAGPVLLPAAAQRRAWWPWRCASAGTAWCCWPWAAPS